MSAWKVLLFFGLLVCLPMAITGLVLAIRGWRGRIVGDHPYCRACGFDLFALPADREQCPECGAGILEPNATRIGERQRQPERVAWGLGLMLPLLLLGGGAAWNQFSQIDLTPYKPTFWLVSDALSSDGTLRSLAIKELTAREISGRFSGKSLEDFNNKLLLRQADLSKPWEPTWGDFIERTQADGHLSKADWARYARQMPVLSLVVRPRVALGQPIPCSIGVEARTGTTSDFVLRHKHQVLRVGEVESTESFGGGLTLPKGGRGGWGTSVRSEEYRGKLNAGEQMLRFAMDWDVAKSWDEQEPAIAAGTTKLQAPFTLLPEGQPSVQINRDPGLRPAVERAVMIQAVVVDYGHHLSMSVSAQGPLPVGVGYEAFALSGNREYKCGSVAWPANPAANWSASWGIGGTTISPAPETVDVILKPSVEAAASTIDTFEIWDGEILFKDIKVEKRK